MEHQSSVWDHIHAAGIHLRRTPDNTRGWDYAIPAIQRDWYGPYPTEAEALAAAIQYLIRRVQPGDDAPPTSASPAEPASRHSHVSELKRVLQARLQQLQLEVVRAGMQAPPQLLIELEDIKAQLATFDDRQ